MSLSQELLQESEYQQFSQDATFSQELEAFEASLDKNRIQTDLIQELTAEVREKLTPEDKEEQVYIKTREMIEDYIDKQSSTQLQKEHAEVLNETSYGYFDLIKDNTEVFNKMALALGVSDANEERKSKKVKEWCEKIESIRTSYISGSLDIKLPKTTLKSMSSGLAVYFTERLNTSGVDVKAVITDTNGITQGGIGSVVTKMATAFGKIGGFSKIMNTVNSAVKVINSHSGSIVTKDVNNKEIINPECAHVFNTPHGFYDWLGSISSKQLQNKNLSFEEAFTQKGTSSKETISKNIIGKLNYNEDVHTLMEKVVHEGKSVLDLRNAAKGQVDSVFESIQSVLSGFGVEGVAKALDFLGLKGIADFVCLLLGYGSVDGMEKKYREKQLNKELSGEEKKGLDYVVSYANKYANDSNYLPQSHDAEGSFLGKTGLKRVIDDYNANNTPTINTSVFPSSPDLIVDSFITGFQKGDIVPDPIVLQQIPGFSSYVTTTSDPQGNNILSIDESKKQELEELLKKPEEVAKIVDHIALSHQDPAFLASFSEVKSGESAKTPSDYIGLLFTSCIAPTHAANAWKFNAIDRKKLGIGIVSGAMIGLGAAKAKQIAQAAENKQQEEQSAKAKEEHEKKVKEKQEAIASAKAELATTEENLVKGIVTPKAVEAAKEKVTKFEQELKELEKTTTPESTTTTTTETPTTTPTTEETTLALANTADTETPSSNIEQTTKKETRKMKEEYEKPLLDMMEKYKITNTFAKKAILGVISKESSNARSEDSYSGTNIKRIKSIFGSRMKGLTDEEIENLKKDDTKFRDRVYGLDDPTGRGREYGNTERGDGERYRGRGFNGITFKSTYIKLQKLYEERNPEEKSINIVKQPELLEKPEVAAEFAILYFIDRFQSRPEGGNKDLNAYTDLKKAVRDYAQANSGRGNSLDSGVRAEGLKRAMDYAQTLDHIV